MDSRPIGQRERSQLVIRSHIIIGREIVHLLIDGDKLGGVGVIRSGVDTRMVWD